ncbi:MAG TPA: CBS domain-containing protein, partial [Candidatus Angelobacter sp.]|nr:CBS domain-containing protein [Candidatus Angelobacter sp.]
HDLKKIRESAANDGAGQLRLADVLMNKPVVAHPDEPLRFIVNRMAATGLTRFPVVKRNSEAELLGLVGLQDLLKARELSVVDELHRERVLRLRIPLSLQRHAPWLSRHMHMNKHDKN